MSHFEVIVQNYRQVTDALLDGLKKAEALNPRDVVALQAELERSTRMLDILFPTTEEKDEHNKV